VRNDPFERRTDRRSECSTSSFLPSSSPTLVSHRDEKDKRARAELFLTRYHLLFLPFLSLLSLFDLPPSSLQFTFNSPPPPRFAIPLSSGIDRAPSGNGNENPADFEKLPKNAMRVLMSAQVREDYRKRKREEQEGTSSGGKDGGKKKKVSSYSGEA